MADRSRRLAREDLHRRSRVDMIGSGSIQGASVPGRSPRAPRHFTGGTGFGSPALKDTEAMLDTGHSGYSLRGETTESAHSHSQHPRAGTSHQAPAPARIIGSAHSLASSSNMSTSSLSNSNNHDNNNHHNNNYHNNSYHNNNNNNNGNKQVHSSSAANAPAVGAGGYRVRGPYAAVHDDGPVLSTAARDGSLLPRANLIGPTSNPHNSSLGDPQLPSRTGSLPQAAASRSNTRPGRMLPPILHSPSVTAAAEGIGGGIVADDPAMPAGRWTTQPSAAERSMRSGRAAELSDPAAAAAAMASSSSSSLAAFGSPGDDSSTARRGRTRRYAHFQAPLAFTKRRFGAPIEAILVLLVVVSWAATAGPSALVAYHFGGKAAESAVYKFQRTSAARAATLAAGATAPASVAAAALLDAGAAGGIVAPADGADIIPGGFATTRSAAFALGRIGAAAPAIAGSGSDAALAAATAVLGAGASVTQVFYARVGGGACCAHLGAFSAGRISLPAGVAGSFVDAAPPGSALTRQVSDLPPPQAAAQGDGGARGFGDPVVVGAADEPFSPSLAGWFAREDVDAALAAETRSSRWGSTRVSSTGGGLEVAHVIAARTSGALDGASVAVATATVSLDAAATALYAALGGSPAMAFCVESATRKVLFTSATPGSIVARDAAAGTAAAGVPAASFSQSGVPGAEDVQLAWLCLTDHLATAASNASSSLSSSSDLLLPPAGAATEVVCSHGSRGTLVVAQRLILEGGLDWVVLSAAPYSEFHSDTVDAMFYMLLWAALALTVAVVLAAIAARAVASPLQETAAVIAREEPVYEAHPPELAFVNQIAGLQTALEATGALHVRMKKLEPSKHSRDGEHGDLERGDDDAEQRNQVHGRSHHLPPLGAAAGTSQHR